MLEAMENVRRLLLGLTRKELQTRAKVLGVPANLRTVDIVEQIIGASEVHPDENVTEAEQNPMQGADKALQHRFLSTAELQLATKVKQQVTTTDACTLADTDPSGEGRSHPLLTFTGTSAAVDDVRTLERDQAAAPIPAILTKETATCGQPTGFDPSAVHSPIPEPLHLGLFSSKPHVPTAAEPVGGSLQVTISKAQPEGRWSGRGGMPDTAPEAGPGPYCRSASAARGAAGMRSAVSPVRAVSPAPARLHVPSGATLHVPQRLAAGQRQPEGRPQSAGVPWSQGAAAAAAHARAVSPAPAKHAGRGSLMSPERVRPGSSPYRPRPAMSPLRGSQAMSPLAQRAPALQATRSASPLPLRAAVSRAPSPLPSPLKATAPSGSARATMSPMMSPMPGTACVPMSPLMSPQNRMPARRVAVTSTAAGGGNGGGFGGGPAVVLQQQLDVVGMEFYDELVSMEMAMVPMKGGMKSVIGLSSIKERLMATALAPPPQQAPGPPGQTPWLKPLLLFGPSGVGKTFLAKALAAEVVASAGAAVAKVAAPMHGSRHMQPRVVAGKAASASGTKPVGCAFYVDVARLLAEHGAQAAMVAQALFRALQRRTGPAALVLDSLEAIQDLQREDIDKAEAACRLRTAIMVGVDELVCSPKQQQQPAKQQQAAPVGRPLGGFKVQQLHRSSVAAAAAPPLTRTHTVVIVGIVGSRAASLDDGLARCFTSAKIYVPPPDAATREELLFIDMSGREAALGVKDVEELVRKTEGVSAAEVLRLCHLAATHAVKQQQQQAGSAASAPPRQRALWHQPGGGQGGAPAALSGGSGDGTVAALVTMDHFAAALKEARPCMDHASAVAYLKWKTRLVAL